MNEPQDTIARIASAAREVGFDPRDPLDDDDLAPARPIVWTLVVWLVAMAAIALSASF